MPSDRTPERRPAGSGRQPEIIAHRGVPRECPENSLPGFRRALELGADGIELDVHLTADGVVVVHHDAWLRGAPGLPARGPLIRDVPASALADHPLAPGVSIPLLADVLALVDGRATVYVEVKAANMEREVLACLAGSPTRCAIHSFDHRIPLRAASLGSETPTGVLVGSYLLDPATVLDGALARDYWQWHEMIDTELVRRVHRVGGRVVAWTVNDIGEARRLRAIGVDALCTDMCGELRQGLRE